MALGGQAGAGGTGPVVGGELDGGMLHAKAWGAVDSVVGGGSSHEGIVLVVGDAVGGLVDGSGESTVVGGADVVVGGRDVAGVGGVVIVVGLGPTI